MSLYAQLKWPIVNKEAVCLQQDIAAAGELNLNGSLYNSSVPNRVSFIAAGQFLQNGFTRSISITSTNNLSGRTFIINGFQNNAPVSETLLGPNNTTIYGTKFYDVITSITVNGAANAIQVGTGDKGYLPIIAIDSLATTINYSVQILLPSGSGINYSLFRTLDQISTNFITYLDQENDLFPALGLTNKTTSEIANTQEISNFILFKINSSANPITDTFDFVFLQS